MTVSEQLRQEIDRSELSRYALCKAAKLDQSRMSRFMAGGRLSLDQIDRVCKVLKLKLVKNGR